MHVENLQTVPHPHSEGIVQVALQFGGDQGSQTILAILGREDGKPWSFPEAAALRQHLDQPQEAEQVPVAGFRVRPINSLEPVYVAAEEMQFEAEHVVFLTGGVVVGLYRASNIVGVDRVGPDEE